MDFPILPNDIIHKIICIAAEDSFLHLRPLIRAGKRSLEHVFTDEVLQKCNIWWLHGRRFKIFERGLFMKFFEKCLEKGNKQAIFYEGLRLATTCEDLRGSIQLMKPIVPEIAEAALATAIFQVCIGDPDKGLDVFDAFIQHHGKLTSPLGRVVAQDLVWDIYCYGPPNMDTYLVPLSWLTDYEEEM